MTFVRSRFALFTLLIAACALALPAQAARRRHVAEPAEPFRGAIVVDAATGKVLIEENADVVSPPASMTKLMTFAVLQDLLKQGTITLQTPVKVTAADSKIGGTQVWLREGEVFPVEELIYAMMIQSANDAAYALARSSVGSVQGFVDLMNAKARALGMTHTTFRSPHGLPPKDRRIAEGDLTSPRDYAILARYLLLNTDVLKYTSIRTRSFGIPQRLKPVVMVNHNHLLGKIDGVDGLKTGYTGGAGFCLTATAQRNGRRVIVVIMGSPDFKSRDYKVIELLDQGFAKLPVGGPAFAPLAGATTPPADSPISPAPMSQDPSAAPAADQASQDAGPVIKLNVPSAPARSR